MSDNVIQFPGTELDVELEFDFTDEVDQELETVKTMLEIQANGIVGSSNTINWGHIFDASLYLLITAGIRSGLEPHLIKEILNNCEVECANE